MDLQHPPDVRIDGVASTLFLVELRTTGSASTDVEDMQRALRHATIRLRSSGVPIRWRRAVLVPVDSRCLCFIEAAQREQVVAARDVAGIGSATVQLVRPVPDPRPLHGPATPTPSPREEP